MSVKKILYNGLIITIDKDHPTVEAVGIEDEKIIAVGKFEDVKKILESEYDLIDLKGKTLLPGFIDSHMHPLSFMFLLLNLDLSEIKSLKELQELLREACAKRINGEFILALKLKEEEFDDPKLPTRWVIDEVCPNNPVFIVLKAFSTSISLL